MNTGIKWIVAAGAAALVATFLLPLIPRATTPPRAPAAATPASAEAPETRSLTAASPTNTLPLNLSEHYNALLHQQWNRTSYPGDDLSELPPGEHEFNGVRFDIEGVIQLQGGEWQRRGLRFPTAVEGIAVQRNCRYLYLLHADAGAKAEPGTAVAKLVLHYSDGVSSVIDIQHDVHVKDWWSYNRPPPSDPNTVVAWTGQNKAAARQRTSIRLYMTRFENPYPEKRLETLDYVSAMAAPGPFMVGLTLE